MTLCEGTTKKLRYKGSPIHRIVQGGWIQGGDIVTGKGDSGLSKFGEFFADESFAMRFDGPGECCAAWCCVVCAALHGAVLCALHCMVLCCAVLCCVRCTGVAVCCAVLCCAVVYHMSSTLLGIA